MLQIVKSIYKMTGEMVKLPQDEDTPEKVAFIPSSQARSTFPFFSNSQRVDKIFRNMDKDKDAQLTYEEFVEGSKQDPTIVQVSSPSPPPMTQSEYFTQPGIVLVRWLGVVEPCR